MSTGEPWARLIAEHRANQERARAEPAPRVSLLAFLPLVLFWPAWVLLAYAVYALDIDLWQLVGT